VTVDRSATAADVLDQVEACAAEMLADVVEVVRVPSISGTDAENDAQAHMARLLAAGGLEVDHWRIDLERLAAHADFPGMEVERREAWGLVGRLPGAGDGASLMLNGHIDVVPIGAPDAWTTAPFGAEVR
jgi:acetylornithine deacetylase